MSYATTTEIESMFRNLDTTVSNPAITTAEIQNFINEKTAVINSRIGTLYEMPITEGDNPESFKILKLLTKYGVACIIDDILNDYAEADKKPTWCKKFTDMMKALVPDVDKKTCRQCVPTMMLPDAVYIGTPTQKNRITVSATSGTTIKKGVDNW